MLHVHPRLRALEKAREQTVPIYTRVDSVGYTLIVAQEEAGTRPTQVPIISIWYEGTITVNGS